MTEKDEKSDEKPLKIKELHKMIASMSAMGFTAEKISTNISIGAQTVRGYLKTKEMQILIKDEKRSLGLDLQHRLKKVVPKAIDVAEEILMNEKTPPNTRLAAASMFLDRVMGKPVQVFQEDNNAIKTLFDSLDRMGLKFSEKDSSKSKKIIKEVLEVPRLKIPKGHEVKPATTPEFAKKEKSVGNDFDAEGWVDENL